jgi:hypothetical protein
MRVVGVERSGYLWYLLVAGYAEIMSIIEKSAE